MQNLRAKRSSHVKLTTLFRGTSSLLCLQNIQCLANLPYTSYTKHVSNLNHFLLFISMNHTVRKFFALFTCWSNLFSPQRHHPQRWPWQPWICRRNDIFKITSLLYSQRKAQFWSDVCHGTYRSESDPWHAFCTVTRKSSLVCTAASLVKY